MPVTAKLSRRFYDQMGDELANEFVDLLNTVDATYQASLRELNDTNFARFDAKLEQRVAAVESRLEARIAQGEARIDARINEVETRLDSKIAGVESRLDARIEVVRAALEKRMDLGFAEIRKELAERLAASEARMIRWMVTLWTGSILATVGLMIAVFTRR